MRFVFAIMLVLALPILAQAKGDIPIPPLGDPKSDEVFAVCGGVEIVLKDYDKPAVTLSEKGKAPFLVVVFEPKDKPEKEKTMVYIDADGDGKAEVKMSFLELEARYDTVCQLYATVKGAP